MGKLGHLSLLCTACPAKIDNQWNIETETNKKAVL